MPRAPAKWTRWSFPPISRPERGAAPTILGIAGTAASNDQLIGALVVTFSVIAFGEIARPARLLLLPLGAWLLAAPWLLGGDTDLSRWNDVACGVLVIALGVRRGRIAERFGAWNRYLL